MLRILSLVGTTALLVAACHSSGPSAGMPDPSEPMMYRPTPVLHQRVATPPCAGPVARQSTSSSCAR